MFPTSLGLSRGSAANMDHPTLPPVFVTQEDILASLRRGAISEQTAEDQLALVLLRQGANQEAARSFAQTTVQSIQPMAVIPDSYTDPNQGSVPERFGLPGLIGVSPEQFLEEEPRAAFFAAANQAGGSPNQQQFFQNAFGQAYNQFLGALGGQALRGEQTPLPFTDFLSSTIFPGMQGQPSDFPGMQGQPVSQALRADLGNIGSLAQQFSSTAPGQRGAYTQRFAPQARFVPF